jgi:hypothetical protein
MGADMTGKISAWGAAVVGLLFAGLAALQAQRHAEFDALTSTVVAVLLWAGAFRALGQLSGGLRLLAGAWGVAAGMLMSPAMQMGSLRNALFDFGAWALAVFALLPAIPLAGLALTVLHKEQKR